MSKHPLDRQDAASPSRAKRFVETERRTAPEGSHPTAQKAHRQPKDRADGARLKEYTRVERGEDV